LPAVPCWFSKRRDNIREAAARKGGCFVSITVKEIE